MRFRFVVLLGIAGLLSACSESSPPSASGDGAGQVDRGAEVYATSCASCHGAELGGTEKGPPHLSVIYEPNHHGDDSFRSAIANGAPQHHWEYGDMPAVDGLTDEDVEDVIAFVRAEQQRQGFEQ